MLEILLPSFDPLARLMRPVTAWTLRMLGAEQPKSATEQGAPSNGTDSAPNPELDERAHRDERHLLKSIVDFEETLVREIMTPRPDIVAIKDDATIGDMLALFREQEYSRFPVYKESLDNIAGFVFVKDLVALNVRPEQPIRTLLRSAIIVPESKRVPELLKQFQRQRAQIAIVVDEYGGTAGLVTIEDMLEETRRRDSRRIRRGSRADRRGSRGPLRVQRQRQHRRRQRAPARATSIPKGSRRSVAT